MLVFTSSETTLQGRTSPMEEDHKPSRYLETDAPCAAPETGVLYQDYANGVLNATDAERFRAHLLVCLRCAVNVRNARALADDTPSADTRPMAVHTLYLPEPDCPNWLRKTLGPFRPK